MKEGASASLGRAEAYLHLSVAQQGVKFRGFDFPECPESSLQALTFEVFKDLEGSDIGVLGWEGAQEAQGLLEEAIQVEEGSEEESATTTS